MLLATVAERLKAWASKAKIVLLVTGFNSRYLSLGFYLIAHYENLIAKYAASRPYRIKCVLAMEQHVELCDHCLLAHVVVLLSTITVFCALWNQVGSKLFESCVISGSLTIWKLLKFSVLFAWDMNS